MKLKMWYHPRFDMYVPTNPWWGDEWDDELVEVEIEKEEIILDGGSDDPYCHSERWETGWYEENFEHSILTKIPWPAGKYKITIEPLVE